MSQSIIDDIDTTMMNGNAKIKVIGVGGAGGNAVQEMINADLVGVQFICANTDRQALDKNDAPLKIQLGEKLTKGLGAGANPATGRDAAAESINTIRDAIGDADMVFVTAGMGGGTGTGAAPVIAQAAKDMNILTVGVVTKPFSYEGPKRKRMAEDGLEELKKYVDSLIVIPNDRLLSLAPKRTPFNVMLQKANEVLLNAVRGISDVIMRDGLINVDFADVRTTMLETGLALMGSGRANGENRAREAAQQAIMSPLLEDVSLESAKAILYNITASKEITMDEVSEIGFLIQDAASSEVEINIIFGVVYDEAMGDDLQVTVIATGIEQETARLDDVAGASVVPFNRGSRGRPVEQPARRPAARSAVQQLQDETVNLDMDVVPTRRPLGDSWYDERPATPPKYNKPQYTFGQGRHAPGKDNLIYDDDDLEVPTFLRTNAD